MILLCFRDKLAGVKHSDVAIVTFPGILLSRSNVIDRLRKRLRMLCLVDYQITKLRMTYYAQIICSRQL